MLPLLAAVVLAQAAAPAPAVFDEKGRVIGQPLSDRVVAYDIDVKLDPKTYTVDGAEKLTWKNPSDEPQQTLWFHLYWNAFKNSRSTMMREAAETGGFRQKFPDRKAGDWGYSDVTSMKTAAGADLMPTFKFQHPDDDNTDDQTVFTVTLPEPVQPGASVTLDIAWKAHVPEVVARTGKHADYFMFGQWFPKIGVLEPKGVRGAQKARWNCHQFHATTEFYADFGVYDVKMTVPSDMKLGASGVLVDKKDNGDGTTTWHHHLEDVHDFAWTAWKDYVVVEDQFAEAGLPVVKLTLMLHPEHEKARDQYLAAIKSSLSHYGRWWYPFPYPHLTLVDPPETAAEAGGMEYPTLITLGASRDPSEPKDYPIWMVTAHEFGHNYWYGIVATNEFEESWMDEGINSYGTSLLLMAEGVKVGPSRILPHGLRERLRGFSPLEFSEDDIMLNVARSHFQSPIETWAWKMKGQGDYGMNSYARTEINLITLERLVGKETMAKVMRTYVDRWKFKHPRSEDFFQTVNDVTGKDYSWFFDEFFRGTGDLDYSADGLRCVPVDPKLDEGAFDDGNGGKTLVSKEDVEKAEREAPRGKKDKRPQRCTVVVEREGEAWAPVDVKVTWEDGSTQVEHWDGKARFVRWVYVKPSKVKVVEVDPEHQLALLDEDHANDTRTRKASGRTANRFLAWLTYSGQLLATAVGALF